MCYIYIRLLFGIACLAYHTAIKFALYQPLYPEFIVNYCFDIKRAAATFALFACTLNGKHKRYCDLTREQLSAISVPDAVHCTNVNCSDPVHIEETTRFYIAILDSLQDSSYSVFQQSGNGRGGSYSNKPGWADYVSDLYKDSRDMGKMWCNAGKPRQGQIFELYRQSKSRCKYAIRYIKRHENSLRKESLARKLVDKNPIEFWKEVKHMNASNTPLPTCIDGISGADNIAQMWRDHYSDIFNSVNQTIDVVHNVDESTDFGDVVVLSEEVERAVRELVVNKSCGIDGIYAEHMLY